MRNQNYTFFQLKYFTNIFLSTSTALLPYIPGQHSIATYATHLSIGYNLCNRSSYWCLMSTLHSQKGHVVKIQLFDCSRIRLAMQHVSHSRSLYSLPQTHFAFRFWYLSKLSKWASTCGKLRRQHAVRPWHTTIRLYGCGRDYRSRWTYETSLRLNSEP